MRGLKGHRWLIAACETKIVMADLVSQASREVPRTVLDGRAPTSLAFLSKCSPLLLGEPRALKCTDVWDGSAPLLGALQWIQARAWLCLLSGGLRQRADALPEHAPGVSPLHIEHARQGLTEQAHAYVSSVC